MSNNSFCIILIAYSLIYISIMSFQLFSFFRFKLLLKKNELVSLMDTLYEISIYIVGFLYLALYISSILDVIFNIEQYVNWELPFVIYAVPLMVITFSMLINQGLYAYDCSTFFIGIKKSVEKENIKLHGIKRYSSINRAKVIISLNNDFNVQEKKYVIRTSLNNLQPFIELLGK